MLVLTEEQQQLRDTVQQLVASEAPLSRRRALRDAGETWDAGLWDQLVELGAPAILVAEEHGGLGLGLVELCLVMEALGRHDAPTPLLSSVLAQGLHPDPEAQAAIAEGTVFAVAWREHPRRAAWSANHSFASHDHDRLHAEKQGVLDLGAASRLVVLASRGTRSPTRAYEVDPAGGGVTVKVLSRIDQRDAADLVLEEAPARLLGEGPPDLDTAFDTARVALAAELLGICEAAFELTRSFVCEREQFGRKIGSFQVIQHRLVDCFARLQQARAVVLAAAQAPGPASAALALCWTSEAALHICQEAVQLHGGIGMTDEHDLGFFLKRARVASVLLGSPSELRGRWAAAQGY